MTGLDSAAALDGVSAHRSAGTPSPLAGEESIAALSVLEFGAVLELVAGHAAGELGRERVRFRRPSADGEWIAAELAPVGELLSFFDRGGTVDAFAVPPLARVVGHLRLEGSVLDGSELAAIHRTLIAARAFWRSR